MTLNEDEPLDDQLKDIKKEIKVTSKKLVDLKGLYADKKIEKGNHNFMNDLLKSNPTKKVPTRCILSKKPLEIGSGIVTDDTGEWIVKGKGKNKQGETFYKLVKTDV